MSKGCLFVFSGPSGCGKGTILSIVFKNNPQLRFSVSLTTRAPRPGEVDGKDYFFVTKEEFMHRLENNGLLEYNEYCGNFYGTPLDFVNQCREAGEDVVLEIEPNGAGKVKKVCPDAILIFIMPPSMEALEKRLTGRGTESSEVVASRIAQAKNELACADQYFYNIINPDGAPEVAAAEIENIIKNHR